MCVCVCVCVCVCACLRVFCIIFALYISFVYIFTSLSPCSCAYSGVKCDGSSIKAKGNDATIGRGHGSIPIEAISTAYKAPMQPYQSTLVYPCLDDFHAGNVTYVCNQSLQDPNRIAEHVFTTRETCKPIMCKRPNEDGYNFSLIKEISLEVPTFKVAGLKCSPGYASDQPRASRCTGRQDGEYELHGCTAVKCPQHSSGISVPLGCRCDDGFIGEVRPVTLPPFYKSTCVEIDECEQVVCGGASKCIDEINRYRCKCAAGWKFNGTNEPW